MGPADIRTLARLWLDDDAAFILETRTWKRRPAPERKTVRAGTARAPAFQITEPACDPVVEGPGQLSTMVLSREQSALFEFRLIVDGGSCSDPPDRSGLAGVATSVLTDGAVHRGRVKVAMLLDRFGALIEGRVRPEAIVLRMSALEATLEESLKLFAATIIHPRIDDATTRRAKESQKA